MWTDLRQDIAYAFRLLARAAGFTVVAVLTLALGIGATTAVFSLANWALLRPVPGVERPGEVRLIWIGSRKTPTSFTPSRLSYPNFNDIAPRLRTVALGAAQGSDVSVATETHAAAPAAVAFTTPSYFDVLGVRARAGRLFTERDDDPSAGAHVAVLSERLANALFRAEPAAVGRTIRVNGIAFTVIGVTGQGFAGTHRINRVDLWLPGSTYPAVNHFKNTRYDDRASGGFYEFVARRAGGASWEQVEAELGSLKAWLAAEYPSENERLQQVAFHLMAPIGTDAFGGQQIASMMPVMLGGSALVLLIACSNVASLLLMRGIGRGGEVAVRKALGAGRLRLVRQHLTEGTVLWLAGGAVAVAAVWGLLQTVDGGTLLGLRAPTGPVPLDWRVVAFALTLSLAIGLIFSVVPALRAARVEPAGMLREGASSSSPRRLRVGTVLSAVQLALSLTLVVAALLLAATVRQLAQVDVGFDPRNIYTFSVRPGSIGYSPERAAAYREEFARRLRFLPGVEHVAVALRGPFVGSLMYTRVKRDGGDPLEAQATEVVSSGYFETLRIPVLRGRVFSEDDLGQGGRARPVVIVSELFARELFGTADAVGREIEYSIRGRVGQRYRIIGVVGDVRNGSLTGDSEPVVYEPAALDGAVRPEGTFLIRTRPGFAAAGAVREIAAALEPALPLNLPRWMEEAIAQTRAPWDVLARLMTTLALIAGLLAAVGLYGVIAFGVAARRREFGIRLALGAAPSQLMALALRRTALIAGAGLVLGCAGAAALSRTLQSRLFGVEPSDPLVWGLSILLFAGIALLAAWLPARRAGSVDPVSALRV